MDRLTAKCGNNRAVPTRLHLDFVWDISDAAWSELQCIFDKLSAYEKTGMDPKQIESMREDIKQLELDSRGSYPYEPKPCFMCKKIICYCSSGGSACKGFEWRGAPGEKGE